MTYWDWIRVVNLVIISALWLTIMCRYMVGVRMLDPRNLLQDPSHIGLMRMGQLLLYAGLIEGFSESLALGLPGGPRVFALLPGLTLLLLSAHWGRAYTAWRRITRRGFRPDRTP